MTDFAPADLDAATEALRKAIADTYPPSPIPIAVAIAKARADGATAMQKRCARVADEGPDSCDSADLARAIQGLK